MVKLARDLHRPRKSTGPVEPSRRVDALQPLTGPHQDGVPVPRAPARNVEAVVQAVDEKHIPVPFLAQQRSRSIGEAGTSVTRQVGGTAVGLGLDDSSDECRSSGPPLVDEHAANQSPRQDQGVAGVPRARVAISAKGTKGTNGGGVSGHARHGAGVTRGGDGRTDTVGM
jgi:hypothetical protein